MKSADEAEIRAAHRHSSGTTFTLVATMVRPWGEWPGLDWIMKRNVSQCTKSGAAAIVAAARGEMLIGIFFTDGIVTEKVRNVAAQVAAPCKGTGDEMGPVSIVGCAQSRAREARGRPDPVGAGPGGRHPRRPQLPDAVEPRRRARAAGTDAPRDPADQR